MTRFDWLVLVGTLAAAVLLALILIPLIVDWMVA